MRIPEWEDVDDPVKLNSSFDHCYYSEEAFTVRSIKRVGKQRRTWLSEKIDRYVNGGFKVD